MLAQTVPALENTTILGTGVAGFVLLPVLHVDEVAVVVRVAEELELIPDLHPQRTPAGEETPHRSQAGRTPSHFLFPGQLVSHATT
jgi:hypothetical protein